ncbi:MAG: metal-dependent hydrolase, partial [Desulfitobacteriaceae bacterium]|nr:metal-dependent hydrolase [Desulfitobacteriaceae bacterium]
MKISFEGQACVVIEGSKKIIIDPFLTGNPTATKKAEDMTADYILVSHGHGDHLGDTIAIAKRTKAKVIAPFELAKFCGNQGVDAHDMHIGGSHQFDGVRVKLTPAWHGSAFVNEEGIAFTGSPCGFLIWLDGKCLYHSGDTGLFSDMREIIGRFNKIDIAFLPIGDNYTMGPDDAVIAAEWLKAGTVIPIHYNTWPLIEQDPELFKQQVEKETESKCVVLKPGQSME